MYCVHCCGQLWSADPLTRSSRSGFGDSATTAGEMRFANRMPTGLAENKHKTRLMSSSQFNSYMYTAVANIAECLYSLGSEIVQV